MFEKMTTLTLSGANFTNQTPLELFKPSDNGGKIVKGTLLFGRNGSGKSTIARAFRKLAGEDVPTISYAAVFDADGHQINLSEEEKNHIFVFDEEFVDRNVKFQADHLDTIVMLGEAADLSERIKKAEEEERLAREDMEAKEKEYNEYQNTDNKKSPEHYIKKMRDNLQGDNNWAGRDRIINEARRNTPVSDNTYLQFLDANPQKSRDELIKDYYNGLERLNAAKNEASIIKETVPNLYKSYLTYDDKEIQRLLAEKIEKPEFSEREKKILDMVHKKMTDEMNNRIAFLKKEDSTECPYCFQSLSREYKESLVSSYERVLSKKVEEHQSLLQKHIFDEIAIDLSPFINLLGGDHYKKLIETINKNIAENNKNLLEKKNHPYEPIDSKNKNIKASLFQLKEDLMKLESARKSYNEDKKKTEPIRAELTKINKEIAYYDVIEDSKKHKEQKTKMEEAEQLYKNSITVREQKKQIVEDLNAQRRNIKLAVKAINACMKYIFFSDNRLSIECAGDVYKLKSHGTSVMPNEISVGERNILGLSYFFTSILQEKDETAAYNEEYLLVIDDPISSYDRENKIGILSFLRYKLGIFLEGNQNTKALVMTHDLMAFYDIEKIFREVSESCKNKFSINKDNIKKYEINEKRINSLKENPQEYTEILTCIYKYASMQDNGPQQDLVIGNMMRQALEAYGTFVYKKGIEKISLDHNILNQIPVEFRSYYRNLMYRLVLHGGSHREEQIKAMSDFYFFEFVSQKEKIRTAREILCFLYLLNPLHIQEHLKECDKDKVFSNLELWRNEIRTRAAN